ncbi:hypothetical protein N9933_01205 [bacterium]|nr:hypothetical protein [bacterium]
MNIKEMHYDFKMKLNKVDSQGNRNYLVPEIDWYLNAGSELFIRLIVEPRMKSQLGFEINQRMIDDIRTLVKTACNSVQASPFGEYYVLPIDYKHFISGTVRMEKGICEEIPGEIRIRQHNDNFENSPFDKSSFEWRIVNGVFDSDGIRLGNDGTFTIDTVCIQYVREHIYMHNAEDYKNNQYNSPSGALLTGTQDSELPVNTHREIVDLAVYLATQDTITPDLNVRAANLKLNQLI